MKKLKILLVCSELSPWATFGDLGEGVKSLALSLAQRGHDVRIFIPLYKKILSENIFKLENVKSFDLITTGNNSEFPVGFWKTYLDKKVPVYFLQNDFYFTGRHKIYGYVDDPYRFVFFNMAAIKFLLAQNWIPDIIHTYDWHTAAISAYLKFHKDDRLRSIANVFTINDIKYQGITEPEILDFAGLPNDLFHPDGLEFFGKLNLSKSGILYSDIITTTSESYAAEIQTVESGAGLGGLLQLRHNHIKGIVHGIDTKRYNPQTNERLTENYQPDNLFGKIRCKRKLQKELDIPINSDFPLILIPGHLIDPIAHNMLLYLSEVLKRLEVQIVVIEPRLTEFEETLKRSPIKTNCFITNININWRENIKLWAGADMILLPSKKIYTKELLLALRYGVIPIVYGMRGMDNDFVTNFDNQTENGNGFIFYNYNPVEFLKTFKYALDIYNKAAMWNKIVKNALSLDLSWETTVDKYISIYNSLTSIYTGT